MDLTNVFCQSILLFARVGYETPETNLNTIVNRTGLVLFWNWFITLTFAANIPNMKYFPQYYNRYHAYDHINDETIQFGKSLILKLDKTWDPYWVLSVMKFENPVWNIDFGIGKNIYVLRTILCKYSVSTNHIILNRPRLWLSDHCYKVTRGSSWFCDTIKTLADSSTTETTAPEFSLV